MNPATILALLSDLYAQVTTQTQQIAQLAAERDALRSAQEAAEAPPAAQ